MLIIIFFYFFSLVDSYFLLSVDGYGWEIYGFFVCIVLVDLDGGSLGGFIVMILEKFEFLLINICEGKIKVFRILIIGYKLMMFLVIKFCYEWWGFKSGFMIIEGI